MADKPALAVDNFPGIGQGNVYAAIAWDSNANRRIVFNRADQGGTNWNATGVQKTVSGLGGHRPALAVRPNHDICLLWVETNNIMFAKSSDRGTNFVSITNVVSFAKEGGFFRLERNTNSHPEDHFNGAVVPTLLANPANSDLYVVYHDQTPAATNTPSIFFIQSTNAGLNWDPPIKVNSDATTNDHWQPVMTVKPDGSQLFLAWYDRRTDTASNSLIQIYGSFANVPITTNSFTNNFLISASQFPPIFSGIINTNVGQYDPVYAPRFGTNDPRFCGSFEGLYRHHMGDYDTAVSDNRFVFFSWFDGRNTCTNGGVIRHQADIRSVRLSWRDD
jgi:hypothetical protein